MTTIKKIIPLNRVEGDLEIHLELDRDNVVAAAKSVGTMYRGIENLMTGRGPLDSLVITPRICGICTTAHLNAAAKALDMAYNVSIPADAHRLRSATLMVEQLQNDLRHLFLLFMPDFTRTRYADHPLYEEAVARYWPLKGQSTVQTLQETKKLIEIIAILEASGPTLRSWFPAVWCPCREGVTSPNAAIFCPASAGGMRSGCWAAHSTGGRRSAPGMTCNSGWRKSRPIGTASWAFSSAWRFPAASTTWAGGTIASSAPAGRICQGRTVIASPFFRLDLTPGRNLPAGSGKNNRGRDPLLLQGNARPPL